jgi:hypothetical protein
MVTNEPPSIGPLAGESAEIVGAGAAETLSEKYEKVELALESVTFVVKENVPARVGTPAMIPVAGLKAIPGGI